MAVLILIGIIPLVVFTLIFINTYRAKAISQRINELQTRGSIICNLVVSSAYFTSDSGAEVDSELTQVADIFGGRILIADSDLNITRDTYGLEEGKVILLEEVVRCVNGADSKFVSQSENMVELVLPVHNPESNSIDGVVVMNFSLNSVNTLYDSMQSIAITLALVLGLIILVISVLYSGQVVMPMKEVAGSIAMISSGDFAQPCCRLFQLIFRNALSHRLRQKKSDTRCAVTRLLSIRLAHKKRPERAQAARLHSSRCGASQCKA